MFKFHLRTSSAFLCNSFYIRQIFSELALIFQSNFSKISAWCSYKIVLIKKSVFIFFFIKYLYKSVFIFIFFFLILMIDINTEILKAMLGSFADDTRVWHAISSALEINQLQDDLNKVFTWTDLNNQELNDSKSDHMRMGHLDTAASYTSPAGTLIPTKKCIKDLGILMEDNLLFHQHITVAKGLRISGWALRTFRSRGTILMKTLLNSLIICLMEYACVVWSPTDTAHINLLESVQRKFTSRFSCFQTFDADLQKLYNIIPTGLRELENIIIPSKKEVDSFKLKLDQFLSTKQDIPGNRFNSLLAE